MLERYSAQRLSFASGILQLVLLCVILFHSFAFAEDSTPSELSEQKTILILSSRGGYGHTAAVNTLKSIIGDEYQITVVHPIDQLRIWGVPSGEQFYNMVLRKGWVRSMNFIVRHIAPRLFHSRQSKLEKIIQGHIETHQPDLVISLIPFVNYPASEAARKKDTPYLLITTDNDLRNWVCGLEKLKHPHFKVTIGVDLPTTRDVLLRKKIPDSAIEVTGLPLRLDFIEQKDIAKIKEEYAVPSDKPVILLMMGGAGGNNALDYAKRIGKMELNTHLIICSGKNKDLKKSLEKIKLHPTNSMTVMGFTEKVADLMAISDLVITKPGPGTINEAITMQLPVLIDGTSISLFWERANVDMVVKYGIGKSIRNFEQMGDILRTFLADQALREQVDKSFAEVPRNQFHQRIKEVIRSMISEKEQVVTSLPHSGPALVNAPVAPAAIVN